MGASGDMLGSALIDLFDDREKVLSELNSLGLPETEIKYETKTQNSINCAHLSIIISGEQEKPDDEQHHRHGRSLADIEEIIDRLKADEKLKNRVKDVYKIIAEAESKAHGVQVNTVHFHELGMLDAIADITIVLYLLDRLNVEEIICSPVNVGNGEVKTAHGILPVPAPATEYILEGIPYYKSDIFSELCTPTGAALLKYTADKFTDEPAFGRVVKTGTGSGMKEFKRANVLRAFLFEDTSAVAELCCNVDDMTGEEIAYASEKMLSCGALDCFVSPIYMKKSRPAYMLSVLCKNSDCEKFVRLIFKHTTTIGLRKYTPSRYTLQREFVEDSGVTVKRSEGYGQTKEKAEFEDIKKLADEKDISVFEARKLLNNKD